MSNHIWPHEELNNITARCGKTFDKLKKAVKEMESAIPVLRAQVAKIDGELFRTVEISIMQRDNAEQRADALQERLNALMFVHCPDEMTDEQAAEFAAHMHAVKEALDSSSPITVTNK